MSDDRWLLAPRHALSPADRDRVWETVHGRGYRAEEVWSVTTDAGFRRRLVRRLNALPGARRLLLPGCGSLTALQEAILAGCPQVESLTCTDLPAAINRAREALNDPRVRFVAEDSARLGERWPGAFDVVLPINSVLADSDEENRAMVRAFREALAPGGHMLGIFPCIYATHDLYRFIPEGHRAAVAQREAVDLDGRASIWFPRDPELPAALPQIFYSVNDLRIIFDEAGFDLETLDLSVDVLTDERSRPIVEKWYQIQDKRVAWWNLMVSIARA